MGTIVLFAIFLGISVILCILSIKPLKDISEILQENEEKWKQYEDDYTKD